MARRSRTDKGVEDAVAQEDSNVACPLCDETLPSLGVEVAYHMVLCGAEFMRQRGASVSIPTTSPSSSSSSSSPTPSSRRTARRRGKPIHEDEGGDEEDEEEELMPKRGKETPKKSTRGSKRSRKAEEEEEEEAEEEVDNKEEEEEEEEPKTPTRKRAKKETAASPMSTSATSLKLKFTTEEEYDSFLLTTKQGRFVRVGEWTGMSKGILHRCTDAECAREWKPSPAQALADDYYCPSCVLHHRNNEDRFTDPRLEWTRHVPNTFYVFSIIDPKTKKKLTKFGRTQHLDAWKRYPKKERDQYKMELLLCLRGKLEVTTKIENWWKSEAEAKGYFCKFSDANFHGKDECVDISPDVLESMLEESKNMLASADE